MELLLELAISDFFDDVSYHIEVLLIIKFVFLVIVFLRLSCAIVLIRLLVHLNSLLQSFDLIAHQVSAFPQIENKALQLFWCELRPFLSLVGFVNKELQSDFRVSDKAMLLGGGYSWL